MKGYLMKTRLLLSLHLSAYCTSTKTCHKRLFPSPPPHLVLLSELKREGTAVCMCVCVFGMGLMWSVRETKQVCER